ncbi:hypothetical protein [Chromobacterium sp. ASV23]|uniref:hypothetical protein n=1 Tax=Chromobacterium sp. ASV23 TaxID=2795110 RepID=UPI0018EE3127|nr:hypothetical protein [Chromobacterium sp. ASV23]
MTEAKKIEAAGDSKPKKPKPRAGRWMTPAEKAECVALWESGEVTLDDLTRKFGRTPETISKVLSDAGAVKGRTAKEAAEKVRSAVESSIIDDAAKIANRIRETKEEHYSLARAITGLVKKEIIDVSRAGGEIGNRLGAFKALEAAMKVLKTAREERFAVLGILNGEDVDVESLPDLIVQELSAEDVATLRAMDTDSGMDEDGAPIEELPGGIDIEEEDE